MYIEKKDRTQCMLYVDGEKINCKSLQSLNFFLHYFRFLSSLELISGLQIRTQCMDRKANNN